MAVIVNPDEKRPTHDVSLSDGVNTIGLILCDTKGNRSPYAITRTPVSRTALKTTSGNQKYSDFEPPWSPVAQEDWSGGRGREDFDVDITRYMDGWRANTMFGKIFLGGQETYTTGYRNQEAHLPGSVSWVNMKTGARKYMAAKFTASASYNVTAIYLWIKRYGTPAQDLNIALCEDDSGKPGTVLQSANIDTDDVTDTVSLFYKFTITSQAIASGTDYWVKIYVSDGEDDNCWKVGFENSAGNTKESSDETLWSESTYDLYYRITGTDSTHVTKFFIYKQMLYAIFNNGSAAPNIYYNGDRGVADSNSGVLTTLVDASKSWTTNEWVGCIVKIIGGAGSTEEQPWRLITANTATTITVDSAWIITQDTTTEYVILGSNKWAALTSPAHGLTVDVTDFLVVNNICYLCQGDSVALRRMRWYNNSGTATYEFAADSTNKATFLKTVRDSTNGLEIWRANNLDANSLISVSKSAVKDWGTDMSFGTAVPFKDDYGKITSICEYGSDYKYLWVFREGSVFTIVDGVPDEIPLKEMHAAASHTNGRAALMHNVYLYFTFGYGLERYYSSVLDDVGPNKADGLPADRQGIIAKLAGYPGRIFAAIDADSGYSSVLGNASSGDDGAGWCEVYRAPVAGQRIRDIAFQPIPGSSLDRLWISVGADIIWIPFPSGEINPTNDSNYPYIHESTIVGGYIYAGLYDVYKFFHSLKLFAENLSSDGVMVEADYQIDEETEWTPLPDIFNSSPVQEIRLKETYGLNGRRLRWRLRLQTTDNTKTPIVKATVVENVSRVPVKYSYSFAYRIKDNDVNLRGEPDLEYSLDVQEMLDRWATELTPLVMHSLKKQYDNKTVFIEPAQTIPIAETNEEYAENLVVIEV